jgi:hypothetical protein
MTSKLNDLLATLPSLSKHDLALVRGAADRLLGVSAATAGPLYDALTNVLRLKLGFAQFQRTATYKIWQKAEPGVVSFMNEGWPGLSKVATMALMTYLLELLVSDLKGRGVPVSLGAVVSNLGRLPEVFDNNFPGYAEAGLCGLVFNAMRG